MDHTNFFKWIIKLFHSFDDEVKDDTHGTFTPEILKIPQATWIATFVEGVTDKSPGALVPGFALKGECSIFFFLLFFLFSTLNFFFFSFSFLEVGEQAKCCTQKMLHTGPLRRQA